MLCVCVRCTLLSFSRTASSSAFSWWCHIDQRWPGRRWTGNGAFSQFPCFQHVWHVIMLTELMLFLMLLMLMTTANSYYMAPADALNRLRRLRDMTRALKRRLVRSDFACQMQVRRHSTQVSGWVESPDVLTWNSTWLHWISPFIANSEQSPTTWKRDVVNRWFEQYSSVTKFQPADHSYIYAQPNFLPIPKTANCKMSIKALLQNA